MSKTPKKILVVSTSFYPKNSPRSFRTTELVKELCRLGHKVSLVTFYDPAHHDALAKEFGFEIIPLGELRFPTLQIRPKGPLHYITRAINRALGILFEYPAIEISFLVKQCLSKITNFDIMISIAMPHTVHWGVAWAKKQGKNIATTWIADCGDAYMGNDLDTFRKPFYFMFLEKWFCKKTDYITIPKIEMKNNFYKEFHHKFVEIPQGFKFSESLKYLKPYQKNPIPTFAFSGNFIKGNRDPKQLFDFLTKLDIEYKFIIFTNSKEYVTPYLEKANGRIELNGFIPRTELLGVLSQMDFLINITFNIEKQIPSKLIDYLLTNRPILNIDENLDDKKVLEFLHGDYSRKFDKLDIERYNIENVCKNFLFLHTDHTSNLQTALTSKAI